jgi:hypothetical protein
VANLCLARARSRSREIAIRLAIGSSRRRLFRQLITESVALALAGCVAGLGLAVLCIRYLRSIRIPTDTPVIVAVQLDARVLLWSLAVGFASAVAFGLVPAWRAGRTDLASTLKGAVIARRCSAAAWQAGVAAQIALALVLLVVAGLMVDAFRPDAGARPGISYQPRLLPVFSVVAPCRWGASPASVRQRIYERQHPSSATRPSRSVPGSRASFSTRFHSSRISIPRPTAQFTRCGDKPVRRRNLARDVQLRQSEPSLRLEPVMRTTPKLQVVNRRRASIRKGHEMVIFEKPALTASASCSDERAPSNVASPNLTLDRPRNVSTM